MLSVLPFLQCVLIIPFPLNTMAHPTSWVNHISFVAWNNMALLMSVHVLVCYFIVGFTSVNDFKVGHHTGSMVF